ncbi:hypothetical protein BGW42_007750 [Actinomortierella wolfii]|nr:hypothetical protein BGW42_007750 [Actinomortierella wolfii]
MSTRRSSRSKPAAATAAEPIHVDSGAATPETTTPPPAGTDETLKKDQQLETSADVTATIANDSSAADTPATPADTPSAAPDEPEDSKEDKVEEASSTAKKDQTNEAAEQPAAVSETTKDENAEKEEQPAKAEEDKPADAQDATATPDTAGEITAGIKRPEPDAKEEAEKETKDYLEGAYKSPFRHGVPSTEASQAPQPQESS